MSSIVSSAVNPLPLLIARVLLASVFLVFGARSILGFAGSVGYFAKLGFPAPNAMVVLAIVIQILGGILLVIGWKTRWAAWLLAAYVLIATLMAHRYWEYDAAQYVPQMTNFFKNAAIIGGLMFVAAFGPGRHSIDKS
jgi:putative oxidoreductase